MSSKLSPQVSKKDKQLMVIEDEASKKDLLEEQIFSRPIYYNGEKINDTQDMLKHIEMQRSDEEYKT